MNNLHRYLINTLSTEAFFGILILLFMAVAVVIFFAVRKIFFGSLKEHNPPSLQGILGVCGSTYAFLVGFLIVVLWQLISQAELVTKNEAERLSSILKETHAFQPEARMKIHTLIGEYTKSARGEEWESIRWGNALEKNDQVLTTLYNFLSTHEPATEREKYFYLNVMGDVKNLIHLRTQRLTYIDQRIPDFFKGLILCAGLIILVLIALLEGQRLRTHLTALILTSSMLAFSIGIILLLDHPFAGGLSVSNKYFYKGELAQFN